MPYETISGGIRSFSVEPDGMKEVEGYLRDVSVSTGKFETNVLHFVSLDKKTELDVFSATALDNILLDNGDSDSPSVKKEYKGRLVKIVLTGLGEKKKGQNPPKRFQVQVDKSKKL